LVFNNYGKGFEKGGDSIGNCKAATTKSFVGLYRDYFYFMPKHCEGKQRAIEKAFKEKNLSREICNKMDYRMQF